MRNAMICVSVMLALFQLWPVLFDHRGAAAPAGAATVAVAPRTILAVASAPTAPHMTPAMASIPAPKSCYRQYQVKFDACSPSDQACHVGVADQWDLCEATGIWPQ